MSSALIIVDVQNDFCEGGSLAVKGGADVARRIHNFVDEFDDDYNLIITTQDWHPNDVSFEHFSETPNYDTTWPVHCVAGTQGAQLHPNLSLKQPVIAFKKGQDAAAYSGFEGINDGLHSLDDILKANSIEFVDICGLATDYCVLATALDANRHGYNTIVFKDLCAAVSAESEATAIAELKEADIPFISSGLGTE